MTHLTPEQIRLFRLHSHCLDGENHTADILTAACGLQNTPPGAWENALFQRLPHCPPEKPGQLLYEDKSLIQAWSFRGAPVVFPASDSDVFLSALIPEEGEPWIYTSGISLALDFLQLPFGELLELLKQVIRRLDKTVIVSKSALDQTLAEWMLPLLPAGKRKLWNSPSMYGDPERQTVGGAVVSFLLRPCSFYGLVVFGKRDGSSPTFTSFRNWTDRPLTVDGEAQAKLVRRYLHCYGPATSSMFTQWLGCSGRQGRRLWKTVEPEMEPVTVDGKKTFLLSADRERLLSPGPLRKELLLLCGHDPFLDQRDRAVLLSDKALRPQVWKTVSNPGAIVYRGEIIGVWTCAKKRKGLEIKMTLWNGFPDKRRLQGLAEEYAAFRSLKLESVAVIF